MSMHDRTIPAYDENFRWERLGRRRALRRTGINPETGKAQSVEPLAIKSKEQLVKPTDTKLHRDSFLGL